MSQSQLHHDGGGGGGGDDRARCDGGVIHLRITRHDRRSSSSKAATPNYKRTFPARLGPPRGTTSSSLALSLFALFSRHLHPRLLLFHLLVLVLLLRLLVLLPSLCRLDTGSDVTPSVSNRAVSPEQRAFHDLDVYYSAKSVTLYTGSKVAQDINKGTNESRLIGFEMSISIRLERERCGPCLISC